MLEQHPVPTQLITSLTGARKPQDQQSTYPRVHYVRAFYAERVMPDIFYLSLLLLPRLTACLCLFLCRLSLFCAFMQIRAILRPA